MITIDNNYLREVIAQHLGKQLLHTDESYGMLTVETTKESILSLLKFLKEHEEIQMTFLTTMCGVHYPDHKGKELGMVYHLHSLVNNIRLRIKIYFSEHDATVPSAIPLFDTANWMEREAFDFYGIHFDGHPNLKRILNVEHMSYHPMRKEYPLEDATRTDKDDHFFGR